MDMQFEFTPDDASFRLEARAWLQANVPAGAAPHGGIAAREYALAWMRQRHASGWSGISWPSEFGGRGLSLERQMIWHEEYVLAKAPSPLDSTFVAVNHAGPTVIACGSQAQKAFHLPKILSGEVLWCQGFSEPGSGSDLASLKTFGEVRGDHLVVNGQKIWTSYADIADYQELLIRTEKGSRRHKGLSWVICDMKTPGITIRPIENLAGATHFAEVFYDDVHIPLTSVVGALHDGWNVAMKTLSFERTTAATALQLELTMKIGQLVELASSPESHASAALLHELAVTRAEAAALRALTYQTLFKHPSTQFDGSIVRLFFAELSQKIHRLAMDLLGPDNVAFPPSDDWPYAYLESFSETIAGGTSEIQRNIIGERILGLAREVPK
jgi:alkylation response protein AidB-like acyl-CoA dehydrogenase